MDLPQPLYVHRRLELDHGRDCLKKFRKLVKCECTIEVLSLKHRFVIMERAIFLARLNMLYYWKGFAKSMT